MPSQHTASVVTTWEKLGTVEVRMPRETTKGEGELTAALVARRGAFCCDLCSGTFSSLEYPGWVVAKHGASYFFPDPRQDNVSACAAIRNVITAISDGQDANVAINVARACFVRIVSMVSSRAPQGRRRNTESAAREADCFSPAALAAIALTVQFDPKVL